MWEKLVALLSELLELYQAILKLTEQKKDILVAGQAPNLEAITRQEELLILQVGKLEGKREKLLSEIAAAHGLTNQGLTLSKIRELANASIAEKLATIETDFEQVTQKLVPLNQLNTQLIQQALNFVNYNINILAQTQIGPTYAPRGESSQPSPSRAILDTKA